MDNNQIIEFLKTNQFITHEMNDFIRNNYEKIDVSDARMNDYSWKWVCPFGSDEKYSHYYIDPENMKYRSSSFNEFYQGIVD